METWQFPIPDEAATQLFGQALAKCLPDQAVIALNGPLGAGKTRLVQAVAQAVGIPKPDVTSPTFVLIQEYEGETSIYHFDAYRLKDEDEFLELGAEEYYQALGWCFIEWAEKVAEVLPDDYLEIQIRIVSECERVFSVSAVGEQSQGILDCLKSSQSSSISSPE